MKNYERNYKNYYVLQNINDIQTNIITNDIEAIINDSNCNNQFQKIIIIYNKMKKKYNIINNDKEEEVLNINSSDILTEVEDEILLKYKIDKDKPKIRIFGIIFLIIIKIN